MKGGSGLEHHFPHLYSQLGVGDTVTVEVQRDAVVFVDVVAGFVVVQDVVVGTVLVTDCLEYRS